MEAAYAKLEMPGLKLDRDIIIDVTMVIRTSIHKTSPLQWYLFGFKQHCVFCVKHNKYVSKSVFKLVV